jgi:hypothetical protein
MPLQLLRHLELQLQAAGLRYPLCGVASRRQTMLILKLVNGGKGERKGGGKAAAILADGVSDTLKLEIIVERLIGRGYAA